MELRGRALFNRFNQFDARGGWGQTGEAGKKIGEQLAQSQEGTIEFFLLAGKKLKGTVLSLSSGKTTIVSMSLSGPKLVVTLADKKRISWDIPAQRNNPLHLALEMNQKGTELFVNGESLGLKKTRIVFCGN